MMIGKRRAQLNNRPEIQEGLIEITEDGQFRPVISNRVVPTFAEAQAILKQVGVTELMDYTTGETTLGSGQIDAINRRLPDGARLQVHSFNINDKNADAAIAALQERMMGDGVPRGFFSRDKGRVTLFDVVMPDGERWKSHEIRHHLREVEDVVFNLSSTAGKEAKRLKGLTRPKRIDLHWDDDPILVSVENSRNRLDMGQRFEQILSHLERDKDGYAKHMKIENGYNKDATLTTKQTRELAEKILNKEKDMALDGATIVGKSFMTKIEKGLSREIQSLQTTLGGLDKGHPKYRRYQSRIRSREKELTEIRKILHGKPGQNINTVGNIRITEMDVHASAAEALDDDEFSKFLEENIMGEGAKDRRIGFQQKGNIIYNPEELEQLNDRRYEELVSEYRKTHNVSRKKAEREVKRTFRDVDAITHYKNLVTEEGTQGTLTFGRKVGDDLIFRNKVRQGSASLELAHFGDSRLDIQSVMSHPRMMGKAVPEAMDNTIRRMEQTLAEIESGKITSSVRSIIEGQIYSDNIANAREAQELLDIIDGSGGKVMNAHTKNRLSKMVVEGSTKNGLISIHAPEGIRGYLMPRVYSGNKGLVENMVAGQLGFDFQSGSILMHELDVAPNYPNWGGFDFDDAINNWLRLDDDGNLISLGSRTPGSRGERAMFGVANQDEVTQEIIRKHGTKEQRELLKEALDGDEATYREIMDLLRKDRFSKATLEELNAPIMTGRVYEEIGDDLFYRYDYGFLDGQQKLSPIQFKVSSAKKNRKFIEDYISDASKKGLTIEDAYRQFFADSFDDIRALSKAEHIFGNQQNTQMLFNYWLEQNEEILQGKDLRTIMGYETEDIIDAITQGSGKLTQEDIQKFADDMMDFMIENARDHGAKISLPSLRAKAAKGTWVDENNVLQGEERIVSQFKERYIAKFGGTEEGWRNIIATEEDPLFVDVLRKTQWLREQKLEINHKFGLQDIELANKQEAQRIGDRVLRAEGEAWRELTRIKDENIGPIIDALQRGEVPGGRVVAAERALGSLVEQTFEERKFGDRVERFATGKTYETLIELANRTDIEGEITHDVFSSGVVSNMFNKQIAEIERIQREAIEKGATITPEVAAEIANRVAKENPLTEDYINRQLGGFLGSDDKFLTGMRSIIGDEAYEVVQQAQAAFDGRPISLSPDLALHTFGQKGTRVIPAGPERVMRGMLDPQSLVAFGNDYNTVGGILREALEGSGESREEAARAVQRAAANYVDTIHRMAHDPTIDPNMANILRQIPGMEKAKEGTRAAEAAVNVVQYERASLSKIWSKKGGRAMIVGGLALAGIGILDMANNRDRTIEDMQGPAHMPGGNPYSDMQVSQSFSPQQLPPRPSGQQGMTYQVRARSGNSDPALINKMVALTGAGIAGTIFGERFETDLDSILGSY